ncbi:alpha/beta fold hydrolase [Candidatus Magnetomonas plexicatena]|uniref:alpha/beta fold hydrolase n=1 Tax=Candidatus Magnetomonas plexicatena TaxID=2552947 RepID=UPI0011036FED|nr:alpha/beta hydrolase [Nitrospirales bacterium LBB_01]
MADLHFIRAGSGDKKIVFIHGNLASSLWWKKTLSEIKAPCEGYAVDLPGCGKTKETNAVITLEYLASLINNFLNALGLKRVTLVGHSMGGGIAQLTALNYPERVEKLVLVNSIPMHGFQAFYSYGEDKLRQLRQREHVFRKSIRNVVPQLKDTEFFEEIVTQAKAIPDKTYIAHSKAMFESDWSERIGMILCQTLFIQGQHDRFVTMNGSMKTAQAIKNCTFVTLPNCGHSPMVETPDEFNKVLFDFVGC